MKKINECECSNINTIKAITICGDKYYQDGKYWGNIVESGENYIKVVCNNGNRYMKGQVVEIFFNQTTLKKWTNQK